MHENDRGKKLNTFGDFENKTPTHMDATHAISKSERDFQNRIPRELDKKFYIPRFVVIHWITSNIQIFKIRLYKKVIPIVNPGIQPTDAIRNKNRKSKIRLCLISNEMNLGK